MLDVTFPLFSLFFLTLLPLILLMMVLTIIAHAAIMAIGRLPMFQMWALTYRKKRRRPLTNRDHKFAKIGLTIMIALNILLMISIIWPVIYFITFWFDHSITASEIWTLVLVDSIGIPIYIILIRAIAKIVFTNYEAKRLGQYIER